MKSSVKQILDREIQELFESAQVGLILCGNDGNLLFANRIAENIWEKAGKELNGQPCHLLLFGNDRICDNCSCENDAAEQPIRQSVTVNGQLGDIFVNVYCRNWQGNRLLTLHDVTREITLLRQTDLDRKELHAKNILLERRRRVSLDEHELLEQLMDHLPDGLLVVGQEFKIQRRNSSVAKMFAGENHGYCFNMLGYDDPCEGCPALEGFAAADGKKKSHEVEGQFYTEIFAVSPKGDGGFLIFRDITRQIGLIEQIRANQQEIDEKNNVLSGLVDFGTFMQKETNVKGVIDYFFDNVLPLLHKGSVAVVVNDVRAGNIWLIKERGLDDGAVKKLSKACLSRELQDCKTEQIVNDNFLPWDESCQLPLIGANSQRVGLLALEGKISKEEVDMLKLVAEPLGSYLHNQLLLRQLEEKAHNDSLTGLFNRAYFSKAFDEEAEKFKNYNINFAVVVADINMLKKINDEYGHDAGDQLIVTAAKAFSQTLRHTDIAARTGGDEFVIILGDCDDASAGRFVVRLQNEIFNNLTIPLPDGEKFPVTVSLGRAGSDMYPVEELVKEADRLMYLSKKEFYKTVNRYR
ncbi:MAG: diguanylate cyclase [Desulfobulbaceae bacterium]|nr:diguanylate cyclase [Desulfobulbaceae bacterium]HIJ78200.1 diguanylate cyclase [Deltaproteobacteria bacterium]